jgi:hypothetical protein
MRKPPLTTSAPPTARPESCYFLSGFDLAGLQTPHVPPSLAQCLQLLHDLHALQLAAPVQVDALRFNAVVKTAVTKMRVKMLFMCWLLTCADTSVNTAKTPRFLSVCFQTRLMLPEMVGLVESRLSWGL